MALKFNFNRPAGKELRRLLVERLQLAAAEFDGETGSAQRRAQAVHKARKRLKESRALLRLVKGGRLSGRPVSEHNLKMRDLARLLSGQRDADAMVEVTDRMVAEVSRHCAERGDQHQQFKPLLTRLRRILVNHRSQQTRGAGVNREQLDRIRTELIVLKEELASGSEKQRYQDLIAAAISGYRKAQTTIEQVHRQPSIDHTHEMRKRVKDHWYQVRLFQPLSPKEMRQRRIDLEVLTEVLGDYQDLCVLRTWLVSGESSVLPAAELAQLLSFIGRRSWRLQQQALAKAEPLFSQKPTYWLLKWQEGLR